MYSKNELRKFINENLESSAVVNALAEQDIVVGDITCGDITSAGDVAISGELSVSGDTNIFENIVDSQGNKRFIEGDISMYEVEGITQTYGKWALSGTHLLIVIAFSVADETALTTGRYAKINIPEWIYNKLVPVFSSQVVRKSTTLWAEDYTSQNITTNLVKGSDGAYLEMGALTLTKDRSGRIEFDLLIDNASEE